MRKIVSLVLLLSALPDLCFAWSGKVAAVLDGGTFTVMHEAKAEKIRYFGIECPEEGQRFHREATILSAYFLLGKSVEVLPVCNGPGDVIQAYVRVEGIQEFINEMLVAHGMAWVIPTVCPARLQKEWAKIQDLARKNRIGLWAEPGAVPPWEWRKRKAMAVLKRKDDYYHPQSREHL